MMTTKNKDFFEKGNYSSRLVRDKKKSEREALDLLCDEIQTLLQESKKFEEQYISIIKHYQRLSKGSIA